jgi:hypothetical protein
MSEKKLDNQKDVATYKINDQHVMSYVFERKNKNKITYEIEYKTTHNTYS